MPQQNDAEDYAGRIPAVNYNEHQAQLAEEIRQIQDAAECATGQRRVAKEPGEASRRWKTAGLAGAREDAAEVEIEPRT